MKMAAYVVWLIFIGAFTLFFGYHTLLGPNHGQETDAAVAFLVCFILLFLSIVFGILLRPRKKRRRR